MFALKASIEKQLLLYLIVLTFGYPFMLILKEITNMRKLSTSLFFVVLLSLAPFAQLTVLTNTIMKIIFNFKQKITLCNTELLEEPAGR